MMQKQELVTDLKQYEQEHLARFYDELEVNDKEKLINEIEKIDFKDLNEKFLKTKDDNKLFSKLDSYMRPIPTELKGSYQNSTVEQLEAYETKGRLLSINFVLFLKIRINLVTQLVMNYFFFVDRFKSYCEW